AASAPSKANRDIFNTGQAFYGALFILPEGLSSGKRKPLISFSKYLPLKGLGVRVQLSLTIYPPPLMWWIF
ncbi:MAG: hypothetical protein ABI970_25530, partial [Chloroflexota bacterium]